jgi:hypothetical protein
MPVTCGTTGTIFEPTPNGADTTVDVWLSVARVCIRGAAGNAATAALGAGTGSETAADGVITVAPANPDVRTALVSKTGRPATVRAATARPPGANVGAGTSTALVSDSAPVCAIGRDIRRLPATAARATSIGIPAAGGGGNMASGRVVGWAATTGVGAAPTVALAVGAGGTMAPGRVVGWAATTGVGAAATAAAAAGAGMTMAPGRVVGLAATTGVGTRSAGAIESRFARAATTGTARTGAAGSQENCAGPVGSDLASGATGTDRSGMSETKA